MRELKCLEELADKIMELELQEFRILSNILYAKYKITFNITNFDKDDSPRIKGFTDASK